MSSPWFKAKKELSCPYFKLTFFLLVLSIILPVFKYCFYFSHLILVVGDMAKIAEVISWQLHCMSSISLWYQGLINEYKYKHLVSGWYWYPVLEPTHNKMCLFFFRYKMTALKKQDNIYFLGNMKDSLLDCSEDLSHQTLYCTVSHLKSIVLLLF